MGGPHFQSSRPAVYEIVVWGYLDARWSHRLGDLAIANDTEKGRAITVLSGGVADQAALLGVLNTLCSIGLPLRSVEQIVPTQAQGGAQSIEPGEEGDRE